MEPILERLLSLFYPPACPACGAESEALGPPRLCETCDLGLERNASACPRCAAPGPSRLCGACSSRPPPFERAFCPLLYVEGGAGAEMLRRWKYGGDQPLGAALGRWLAEACAGRLGRYGWVAPVPARPARLLEHGFHPALSLAAALAPSHGPLDATLLRRVGRRSQVELRGAERRRNAARSFEAGSGKRLRGAHVLIVDDVVTTGATAAACARELLRLGAGRVHVVALARAATLARAAPSRSGKSRGPTAGGEDRGPGRERPGTRRERRASHDGGS